MLVLLMSMKAAVTLIAALTFLYHYVDLRDGRNRVKHVGGMVHIRFLSRNKIALVLNFEMAESIWLICCFHSRWIPKSRCVLIPGRTQLTQG